MKHFDQNPYTVRPPRSSAGSQTEYLLYRSNRRITRLLVLLAVSAVILLLGGYWMTGLCILPGIVLLVLCCRCVPPQKHWQRNRLLISIAAVAVYLFSIFCVRQQKAPWI